MSEESEPIHLSLPKSAIGVALYSIAANVQKPRVAKKIREFAVALEDIVLEYDKNSTLVKSAIAQWFDQMTRIHTSLKIIRSDIEEFGGITEVNTTHVAGVIIRLNDLDERLNVLESNQEDIKDMQGDMQNSLKEIIDLIKQDDS